MSCVETASHLNKVLADHEIENAKWSSTENCVQVWCKCGAVFFYREDRKVHNKHAGTKLLEEVERLLAAERERLQNEIQAYQSDPRYDNRYLQGQDDMKKQLESLLQAERENVREMCANKAENTIYYREVDVLETDPNRLKKQIAEHIRQLDLTKDLAAKGD